MARNRRLKEYEDDDGRSYANMNVEGMPWYRPEQENVPENREKIELTPAETRSAIWGALKAALLVVGVFALVFFLFILFCDVVWFK